MLEGEARELGAQLSLSRHNGGLTFDSDLTVTEMLRLSSELKLCPSRLKKGVGSARHVLLGIGKDLKSREEKITFL